MALENKLGLSNFSDLDRAEEKISKGKALQLFDKGLLERYGHGTYQDLVQIHKYYLKIFMNLPVS